MQVFDLSVAPDTKNLGPNEVGKKELAQLPGADNKYDTATPGELPLRTTSHMCATSASMIGPDSSLQSSHYRGSQLMQSLCLWRHRYWPPNWRECHIDNWADTDAGV